MAFATYIKLTVLHKGADAHEEFGLDINNNECASIYDCGRDILGKAYSVERKRLVSEDEMLFKGKFLDETLVFVEDIIDIHGEGTWVTDWMQEGGYETTFTEDILKYFYELVETRHTKDSSTGLSETVEFIGLWSPQTSGDWETSTSEIEYFEFLGVGKIVLE